MFTEPHSTKQIEDCVGWGLETTPETLVATQRSAQGSTEDDGARARARSVALPGARRPRRRTTRSPARGRGDRARRATGGELVLLEGSGHVPHARDPVKVNLLLRDFVAPRAARRTTLGRGAGRAASARSTSPRRSASATPSATSRSPTSCASCIPTSRSTGSRSTRSPRVLEARGRAHPPGERAARERVAPHRVRVGRARPALLPGDPPDGRDPGRQLHGLPRRRARGALRPLDRRRGLGARLLPAREPRAEARRLRLADRLRRLAADGRRRRARGVPDRRLQRRDDRAHRALPAAARPCDLRRRPRRHRPRRVRAGAARDPRLDRGALRLRRLRHRLRPARLATATTAARARLPRRRAGLHRHRRRLGRRRAPAAPGDRRRSPRRSERVPDAADDRRRRAAHRPRDAAPARRPRGARATCTTSTATSPPATSPSCRAA